MMRAGQGFFVIKDAIPADILKELNEIFDAVQGPVGDDGHMQRAYRLTYDAVGPWQKKTDLAYWHCLDNENWEAIDE